MSHVSWRERVHRHPDDPQKTHLPMQGTAPGGEVAFGTGTGGNRYGNGSMTSAAGTGSLWGRSGDGLLEGEPYIITKTGEHIRLSELNTRQSAD